MRRTSNQPTSDTADSPWLVSNGIYTAQLTGDMLEIGLTGLPVRLLRIQVQPDGLQLLPDARPEHDTAPHETESDEIDLDLLGRLTQCIEDLFALYETSEPGGRQVFVRALMCFVFGQRAQRLSEARQDDIEALMSIMLKREWETWSKPFIAHLEQIMAYGVSTRVIRLLTDHLRRTARYDYQQRPESEVFRSADTKQLLPFAEWIKVCRTEHRPAPVKMSAAEWQDLLCAAEKYLDDQVAAG